MHVLTLGFHHPTPDEHCLNRITACLGGSDTHVCHVELLLDTFPSDSFSILSGGVAGFRPKQFANRTYEFLSLSISNQEHAALEHFCRTAHALALPFDELGMFVSLVHMACLHRPSHAVGKTFCSKIITEALQAGLLPEVDGLNPSGTTPARLFRRILASPRRVISPPPARMQCIFAPSPPQTRNTTSSKPTLLIPIRIQQ